jgi:proteasome lid subunit RPN8/RPN11
VTGLVRGRNVAPDPIMDYVVDSQTLLRQFDFEEQGERMIAIYHSHPVSVAYPSASDAWNAYYPDSAHLICSLQDDRTPIIRAFRLPEHDVSLKVEELRETLPFDETRPGRFAFYQASDTPLPGVLRPTCASVPTPFYVVFEPSDEPGKNPSYRVVSIQERPIEILNGQTDG